MREVLSLFPGYKIPPLLGSLKQLNKAGMNREMILYRQQLLEKAVKVHVGLGLPPDSLTLVANVPFQQISLSDSTSLPDKPEFRRPRGLNGVQPQQRCTLSFPILLKELPGCLSNPERAGGTQAVPTRRYPWHLGGSPSDSDTETWDPPPPPCNEFLPT